MSKTFTISYAPDAKHTTPYIRLQGHWLRAAGFEIGKRIIVSVEQGRLTISNHEEAAP
jgi:hypothetical protein